MLCLKICLFVISVNLALSLFYLCYILAYIYVCSYSIKPFIFVMFKAILFNVENRFGILSKIDCFILLLSYALLFVTFGVNICRMLHAVYHSDTVVYIWNGDIFDEHLKNVQMR